MNIVEHICPVCKTKNEPEAIICKRCGTLLDASIMDTGTQTANVSDPASEGLKDWSIDESAIPEDGIAVYLEGEFKPIHLDSKGEFVIGRKSGTTAKVSESLFDLAPLGGYGRGVSRRHVVIQRTERGYEIIDLGSVNGTWLNNKRLVPHRHYPLASGSHLRLGSMRLFVLYHSPEETS